MHYTDHHRISDKSINTEGNMTKEDGMSPHPKVHSEYGGEFSSAPTLLGFALRDRGRAAEHRSAEVRPVFRKCGAKHPYLNTRLGMNGGV